MGQCSYPLHTEDKTEIQRGVITFLRSHRWQVYDFTKHLQVDHLVMTSGPPGTQDHLNTKPSCGWGGEGYNVSPLHIILKENRF